MFKDYNINQLVLPMNLEMKLQENDIAFYINALVESIPRKALVPFIREEGCPSYHLRMMLKIVSRKLHVPPFEEETHKR